MTNGEKIKQIFPDTKIITQYDNLFGDRFMVFTLNNESMQVNIDWWNAEYKEPCEDWCDVPSCEMTPEQARKAVKDLRKKLTEYLEQEPTTKNDISNRPIIRGDDCISRQAVIDMAGLSEWFDSSDSYNEFVIALSELPPVIPQDSTTKNDLGVDCISRAEAIKCLECDFDITGKENMKTVVNYINSTHDKIVNLPPVTPQEPRKGHWYRQTNDYVDYYECSECGMAMGLHDVKNYCPNCGSRNEVEE